MGKPGTVLTITLSVVLSVAVTAGMVSAADRATVPSAVPKATLPLISPKVPSAALPLTLSVSVPNASEVRLKWNRFDCGGYRVDRKKGSEPYKQMALPATDETTFTDSAVEPNASYTYRVFTRCGTQDMYSNEATINTGGSTPFTETVACPSTAQRSVTTLVGAPWQGYVIQESVQIFSTSTEDGPGGQQRLICWYRTGPGGQESRASRLVPGGSCAKRENIQNETTFKCKKGVF